MECQRVIFPILCQFRNEKSGIPSLFLAEFNPVWTPQQSFDFYQEDDARSEQEALWNECVDKMVWAFFQIGYVDWETQYHHGKIKYDNEPVENPDGTIKHYRVINNNPESHWFDSVGHDIHQERINEGLSLFAKYFESLWT
jgi:hypothetical protein